MRLAAPLIVACFVVVGCDREAAPAAKGEIMVTAVDTEGKITLNGQAITGEEFEALMARMKNGEPLPEKYSRARKQGS